MVKELRIAALGTNLELGFKGVFEVRLCQLECQRARLAGMS